MGSRRTRGSAARASGEAAKLAHALTEERSNVGPLGIWYDLHRDWLEIMAEVAHSWGRLTLSAGSTRSGRTSLSGMPLRGVKR